VSASAARPATARALAIGALVEIDAGARANQVLPGRLAASGLAERDRAFTTELVYGTVRMRRACDWLIDRHLRRRLDPEVRAALRIGAYQLAFLGTPAHAAVSATVAEVAGPARGLVNAVLRRVADALDRGPLRWPDLATELSYPDWLVGLLVQDLGEATARAALVQMNEPAAATRRPDGYTQDLASQQVARAVHVRPGEVVVDLCAAPGGKTTAMATTPTAAPGPFVVGVELDRDRLGRLVDNVAHYGQGRVALVVADGARPPLRLGAFDKVLVDAPCSGIGVLRRRPDARWRIQAADVVRLAALQRRLLAAAIGLLRPGGLLYYSVCTLTLAETAAIDRWLATTYPDLAPVLPDLDPTWERVGRGARLLPQAAGTDGMFLLVLRRT